MPIVFIGVGSNLGDRKRHFELAEAELLRLKDICAFKKSDCYKTLPVGVQGHEYYWNEVWCFETDLSPERLLAELNRIERKSGRVEKSLKRPRTLDLDILFYGEQVLKQEGLIIPHMHLHERAFVLVPFCDLDPEWIHPELRRSMSQLLADHRKRDQGDWGIKKISRNEL